MMTCCEIPIEIDQYKRSIERNGVFEHLLNGVL